MINGKSVLGIIPARGGSKELPGKNIRYFCGKPLIAWTIQAGLGSKWIDRLILSSDDESIINVAHDWGCEVPFKRSFELAKDESTTVEVVLDALRRCPGYDYVVVLQPTSPLRLSVDIDNCLTECFKRNLKVAVSVSEALSSPYWMFDLDKRGKLQPLIDKYKIPKRRQNLPKAYQLNGAVYVAEANWLQINQNFITPETYGHVMPKYRSIDIDDELDFRIAEIICNKR